MQEITIIIARENKPNGNINTSKTSFMTPYLIACTLSSMTADGKIIMKVY